MSRLSRRSWLAGATAGMIAPGSALAMGSPPAAIRDFRVPVLCYHQFGEHVGSTLMVSAETLEAQLGHFANGDFKAIPARRLVQSLLGQAPEPPARSCVLTIDDGYKSAYTIFFPLALKYRIPATIFVYPSAISVFPFALTWQELGEMQASGLIDVQSHSYTHPNLSLEEKRLSGPSFDRFVRRELDLSRQVIEARLGATCDLLAWPYGLSDAELKEDARQAGYIAAFGTVRHPATPQDDVMAIPRFIITERHREASFERILAGAA